MLVRADLNVPMDGAAISDDTRIRAAVPTLKYLVDNGAKVLLTSHLVRAPTSLPAGRQQALEGVARPRCVRATHAPPRTPDCFFGT